MADLQKAVGQCALSMVNMGNNREIPYVYVEYSRLNLSLLQFPHS